MIEFRIGPDVIRSYKRLSYTYWHALAEFVDNSTQSYFNNRAVLDEIYNREGGRLEVRISYDRDNGYLRIYDTAMGMSLEELRNALQVGRIPENPTGRSQYGLGMKTAACWLGDEWKVTTKKYGETVEHVATIDVERVASGERSLEYLSRSDIPAAKHYTIIEIRKLHQKIQGRRSGKIKQFLASMYRVDLREGTLFLEWQAEELRYAPEEDFLQSVSGQAYRKDFSFDANGKTVRGWIGILRTGSRARAGFSILRKNRVVRGHPDAWRPPTIYGQDLGSNDLINQRVVGEIHLDDFEVSHTKDDVLWSGDDEELVLNKLKEEALDYMKIAREHRKDGGGSEGPSDVEITAGSERMRSEMQSKEFVDLVRLEDVPPPEVVEQVTKPVVQAVEGRKPTWEGRLGDAVRYRIYLSNEHSPNDPYFVTDVARDEILVVVNMRHPQWSQLRGSDGVYNYLCQCVYDAIAEWQCYRKTAEVRHDTIKLLKDKLLRLAFELEQAAGTVPAGNG